MGLDYTPGASYGWRARIGMLQPSLVCDTNAFEFYLMAPQGVELLLTSLGLGGLAQAEYDRVVANIEVPVRRLLERNPDVIVQSGIPPVMTHEWGFHQQVRARVAEITPLPFITDAAASIAAMQATGISRVVVLGNAFNEELVAHVTRYLKAAGIAVIEAQQLRPEPGTAANALTLGATYRAARSLYARHAGQTDGIWLTQASNPSVGVIADLERDLGVPVVTSAQALMWAALRLAGVRERLAGFGRLFDVDTLESNHP